MGQAKQRGTQAERIAAAKTIKEQNVTYEQPPIIPPTPRAAMAMAMLLALGSNWSPPTSRRY